MDFCNRLNFHQAILKYFLLYQENDCADNSYEMSGLNFSEK